MDITNIFNKNMFSLHNKQGVKIWRFQIDPVLIVLVIIALALSIKFTSIESVIYWLKVGEEEKVGTLRTEPIKTINKSLVSFFTDKPLKNNEKYYQASLDGVTTYPFESKKYRAMLRLENQGVESCIIEIKGNLYTTEGGINPKSLLANVICMHYLQKVTIGSITLNELSLLPNNDEINLQSKFALNRGSKTVELLEQWEKLKHDERLSLINNLKLSKNKDATIKS